MKILGSDFDGTLNYEGLDAEKLDAIRAWRAAGNRFGVIRRRHTSFWDDLKKKHPELELDFLACLNGAYIFGPKGEVISETRCTCVPIKEAIAKLLALGCGVVRVSADRYLYVAEDPSFRPDRIADGSFCLLSELPELPFFYQLSVTFPSPEEATDAALKIRQAFRGALNPLANRIHVDVVAGGMNKAQGLRCVMRHYGAREEDVIAVGDNLNDADMIREFRSYAMENGVDEIKRYAGQTVRSVTELIKRELSDTVR